MFNIAVCDDKKLICAEIENVILDYRLGSDVKIEVDVFYSAFELFSCLKQGGSFQLIFLDIEIPSMNGIELADNIRNYLEDYRTKIVFVSGSEMYYRELFDVQPLHFLLKPFKKEDIIKDLELALHLCGLDRADFEYCIAREWYRLPVAEIIHIQSEGRRMVVTTSDDCVKYYGTTDEAFEQVKNHRFLRIHRAFIVNYEFITRISADSLTTVDGQEFSIGRSYKEGFHRRVAEFERDKMR